MALPRNEGWRGPCEAGTGIESRTGQPLLTTCGQPGKWFNIGPFGVVLCGQHEEHSERFIEQWRKAAEMQERAKLARQEAKRAS